jgi:hypothetical protein
MIKMSFWKNLGFEIMNFFIFLWAALRFWDKRMRIIVWGTVKRQISVYFSKLKTVKYVEQCRNGNCNGCGTCCCLIRKCPYLTDESKCGIYENRHLICRIYPVSDFDTSMIAKISDKKCGFYFTD